MSQQCCDSSIELSPGKWCKTGMSHCWHHTNIFHIAFMCIYWKTSLKEMKPVFSRLCYLNSGKYLIVTGLFFGLFFVNRSRFSSTQKFLALWFTLNECIQLGQDTEINLIYWVISPSFSLQLPFSYVCEYLCNTVDARESPCELSSGRFIQMFCRSLPACLQTSVSIKNKYIQMVVYVVYMHRNVWDDIFWIFMYFGQASY